MDSMSYRNNRPAARQSEAESAAPAAAPQPVSAPAPASRTKHSSHAAPKRKKPMLLVGVILAIVLLAAAAWFFLGKNMGPAAAIDGSKYQAVFFTNGQVYFGKLSAMNRENLSLKNVFYLKNKDGTTADSSAQTDLSNVELVKLGTEIHGPEDEMIIERGQVLFYENLKSDGKVSQAISNFQNKGN